MQPRVLPTDPHDKLGVRRVINVAGNMTSLGASIAKPEVIEAVADILPHFVEIDDLQRRASQAIAKATGAEAGCVTACASAGVSISVAGAMTGANLAAIEALPDTAGLRDTVIVQLGHLCHYSAPIDQAVRLTGARLRTIGSVNEARPDQLAAALDENVAAMLFVVSHQTMQHGQIPLSECVRICRTANVPVIVDAAAEMDLSGFLSDGADIAIYSAHKALGGMTGGIVAGKTPLVRAAYLQNAGIGRGMKVGKEGIAGTIAALDAWAKRDRDAEWAAQQHTLTLWREAVAPYNAIKTQLVDDPTDNPIQRLRLAFQGDSNAAATFAARLAQGDPPVIVRDEFLDRNCFELDPCNLHPGEAEIVAERLQQEAESAGEAGAGGQTLTELRQASLARRLAWPD